jgi:hypothetical protein
MSSVKPSMIRTFASKTSERDMPGLRGSPAVMTTNSESLRICGSLLPLIEQSKLKYGAIWRMSSATPSGTSSRISMSAISRHNSFAAGI